jgi:signal-transduction protein with cAMP-binding, CBS, and nucleotidyltransferase domain
MASASSRETIRAAAQKMAAHAVGTLVVLDATDGAERLGIVTDRDIVIRCVAAGLDPDRDPIGAVTTRPVHCVDEQTPVEDAMQQMAKAGTRRLVVLGESGRPVGVLSLDDVLDLLADETGAIGRLLATQQSRLPATIGAH